MGGVGIDPLRTTYLVVEEGEALLNGLSLNSLCLFGNPACVCVCLESKAAEETKGTSPLLITAKGGGGPKVVGASFTIFRFPS